LYYIRTLPDSVLKKYEAAYPHPLGDEGHEPATAVSKCVRNALSVRRPTPLARWASSAHPQVLLVAVFCPRPPRWITREWATSSAMPRRRLPRGQTRIRAYTNRNDTEASAMGISVCACDACESKCEESSGVGRRAMRLMGGRGVGECGSGRHSYGGVISQHDWLSLRGALPRRFCLVPCSLLVRVGESGSGREDRAGWRKLLAASGSKQPNP